MLCCRHLACALLLVACAAADTIRLKNGRTIVADSVREKGNQVEYRIGEDTYGIPRSIVESISTGGVPVRASAPAEVPPLAPTQPAERVVDMSQKIIREGAVDRDALAAIERASDAETAAAAFYTAGRHELVRSNNVQAAEYLKEAARLAPENPLILEEYASALLQTGRGADALPFAERAVRLVPGSADAQMIYGFALYQNDRTKDAIEAWKKSLAVRPNASVQAMLERAERELSAEADYGQQESGHFTMRYEGSQASPALRRQLLETLESHYADLLRELGSGPRQNVVVILYPQETYFDVTRAPQWSAAVNDGRLRIPLRGVQTVSGELSSVLRHELAHSFINALSRGRCPLWLHEGVAQLLQGKTTAPRGRLLARAFAGGRYIPLNALEGSFLQYTDAEALLSYDEALAAAEYIQQTYGTSDLVRILQRIGEGSSTEAALRATVHSGYAELEREIAAYLKERYGE